MFQHAIMQSSGGINIKYVNKGTVKMKETSLFRYISRIHL